MNEHIESNRKLWDAWAGDHAASEFYDVEGFKAGRCTLQEIERQELGEVAGKSLLHLQCHFGLDTLSWARLGAKVTGADFSPKAIEIARSLATECGIGAEFVCSNLYDLPDRLTGQFDVVYTSLGVLCWLPELEPWAEMIAHFLKPAGVFYMCEFHRFAGLFAWEDTPRLEYPYFHNDQPVCEQVDGSYAGSTAGGQTAEWSHSLSDIIGSLLSAGMELKWLHEFPFTNYRHLPFLTQGSDGMWRYEALPGGLPLMFSIKAVRS